MARGAGRGDCSREAIILSISVKGRTIIRGRRLIEGRLLFEEIPYMVDCTETLEDVTTDDFEEGFRTKPPFGVRDRKRKQR